MGKYSSYVRDISTEKRSRKEIHPIWRGIGFILMVVVPIASFLLSIWLLERNATQNWFPIPIDILSPWGPDPLIFVKLFMTLIVSVVVFAILMLIRFVMNLLFGPPRYGPHDAPPIRSSVQPRRSR